MSKYLSIDFESSISTSIHGPTFRDPSNDIYTQIWATHPDDVHIAHRSDGFGRLYESELAIAINNADVIIGHNLSFDLCYVWNTDIMRDFILRGGKIWDTQLAEYLLTGQQHAFASLAELQIKYLGVKEKPSRISYLYSKGIGADKIVQASKRCPRLWKLYKQYCTSDGSSPLKIFKLQMQRAKAEGMVEIIELYNDYLLSIINMTCTGIHIDTIKTEKTLQEFNLKYLDYLEQAQNILKSVWTDPRLPPFNINSTVHKSAVLFGGNIDVTVKETVGYYKAKPIYEYVPTDRFKKVEYYDEINGHYYTKMERIEKKTIIGYEDPRPKEKRVPYSLCIEGLGVSPCLSYPSKKEGVYSTDDAVMSSILESSNNQQVIEYCNLQKKAMMFKKAAKTYLQAFLDRSVNGILYPNYNNTITPTGRISSSEPNMQNLPSKSETAEKVEGCLVAPENWVCVSADFSQLEKWVQCLVSGDKVLQAKLEDGACLHCITLAGISNLDYNWVFTKAKIEQDPVWDAKRTAIKPVGFLMDYGGMPKRVSIETGLSLEEVEEIYRIDRETYPQKHKFFEETLPAIVNNTATISRECNIPASRKKGKDGSRFINGVELLPIFDKSGDLVYNDKEVRQVGYWQTDYGKKYAFMENGRETRNGLRRGFSKPQFKNYPNQGGGSDIQAATSAELLTTLLQKPDVIKMIMEIHDSKRFYVLESRLDEVLRWLKKTIEDVPKIFLKRFNVEIPFKFPIEFEVGKDFGNMSKYNFN